MGNRENRPVLRVFFRLEVQLIIQTVLMTSASGLTNTMHQLGGPIGLSIIMAQTSDFHYQTAGMAGFSVISTIIVYIFIYQNGGKPALD